MKTKDIFSALIESTKNLQTAMEKYTKEKAETEEKRDDLKKTAQGIAEEYHRQTEKLKKKREQIEQEYNQNKSRLTQIARDRMTAEMSGRKYSDDGESERLKTSIIGHESDLAAINDMIGAVTVPADSMETINRKADAAKEARKNIRITTRELMSLFSSIKSEISSCELIFTDPQSGLYERDIIIEALKPLEELNNSEKKDVHNE